MAQQLYLQLHYSGLSPTTDFHSPTTSYHRTSSSSLSPSPVMAVGTVFRPTRPEDWEPYRDLIAHLYTTMKLKDVMNEMHTKHNFKATEKQYKTQIKKWNLDTKYTKASEYMAMIKTKRRRENENPPKQTRFILRGRPVDPKDINRFEKRASKKGMMKDEELAYNTKGMPHNNHHVGCRQQVNTGDEEAEDIEDLVYITPSPSPEPTFSSCKRTPPPPPRLFLTDMNKTKTTPSATKKTLLPHLQHNTKQPTTINNSNQWEWELIITKHPRRTT